MREVSHTGICPTVEFRVRYRLRNILLHMSRARNQISDRFPEGREAKALQPKIRSFRARAELPTSKSPTTASKQDTKAAISSHASSPDRTCQFCTGCRQTRSRYITWRTPTPATSFRRPTRWSRASAKRQKPRISSVVRSSCRPSCWLSRRIRLMGVRCMLRKRRER
jgi:hypothetical protein